jgi:hypothetical protein
VCVVRFAEGGPAGETLDAELARASASFVQLSDLGRAYAGDLTREAYAGDTPPMVLWGADTPHRQRVLRQARRELRAVWSHEGLRPSLELRPDNPAVTCVALAGPEGAGAYLVNRGTGPARGLRLRLRADAPSRFTVWADLQPAVAHARRVGPRLEIDLPPFQTSCILRPAP